MTVEPKSYHEKKDVDAFLDFENSRRAVRLDAFLDFENSALEVQDAVISFGVWDHGNEQWQHAKLTSNETKAFCLSMVTYFKAYDSKFAAQLEGVFISGKMKNKLLFINECSNWQK